MKKILVVDDEIQILKSISRMFLETDYEVFTAENSNDALRLIETENIDMIISDMRMPMLDGYKLLDIVKEKYPKIIRIILSGYADEKPMYRALLHNLAELYVFKPWNNKDFLQNIDKLFKDENMLNSKDLVSTIEELGCSSDIPANCAKIISKIYEEDMDAVVREIEQDKEVSELLIEVAKSAVYGVMPNTVKQAAIYIGLPNLKCFMYWACAADVMKKAEGGYDFEMLRKHAYLTNRIFLFLYEAFLHKQPPESAMFAGLMHNVGLILLINSLLKKGSLKGTSLSVSDLVHLDIGEYELSHQMIGAHFLNMWDLPFSMYEAALYHHRPLDTYIVNHELIAAVHIAQAYAWKVLQGSDYRPVQPEVFKSIDISVEEFEKRLARYLK